ncbi:MAG: hypothetical protein JO055_10705 [Alphaproteobacteria bacterium]|nr:hypothetical protein [Alphaproteobacteria bacterium]
MAGIRAAIVAVVVMVCAMGAAHAQMPAEWPKAAGAVLDIIEKDSPLMGKPRAHNLYARGWDMARKWRLHNNRNTEITFGEYLSWVQICRTMGCEHDTMGGKPYRTAAAEVKAEKSRAGGQDPAAEAAYRWTESVGAQASGASAKAAKANAELWRKNGNEVAGDFATSNIFMLGWLIAQQQPSIEGKVDTLARYGLFAHGVGWIGDRCLDISRIASILDGEPKIEACK